MLDLFLISFFISKLWAGNGLLKTVYTSMQHWHPSLFLSAFVSDSVLFHQNSRGLSFFFLLVKCCIQTVIKNLVLFNDPHVWYPGTIPYPALMLCLLVMYIVMLLLSWTLVRKLKLMETPLDFAGTFHKHQVRFF